MATNFVTKFAKLADPSLILHAGVMNCRLAISISKD